MTARSVRGSNVDVTDVDRNGRSEMLYVLIVVSRLTSARSASRYREVITVDRRRFRRRRAKCDRSHPNVILLRTESISSRLYAPRCYAADTLFTASCG